MMKRTWLLIVVVLATRSLFAQEELRVAPVQLGPVPCPYPYSRTFTNGPRPTPIATEFAANMPIAGSVWNQTVADKHFGHTFTFPTQRDCCVMSKGTLSVTIKALQTAPKNGSGSANDAVHLVLGGASAGYQQPWLATGVTAGTTATVTFPLTAAQLANGKISFWVQDDAAVIAAELLVSGCCIRTF